MKKILFFVAVIIIGLSSVTFGQTLLEDAYKWWAKEYIINWDSWVSVNSAWETLVKAWQQWTIWKIAKIMLQVATALWVTLFLYWGLLFLTTWWDDSKMKKTRDSLFNVWFGLLLALWSTAVLSIMSNLAKTVST